MSGEPGATGAGEGNGEEATPEVTPAGEAKEEETPLLCLQRKAAQFVTNLKAETEDIRASLREFGEMLDKFMNGEYSEEESEFFRDTLIKKFVYNMMNRDNRYFHESFDMADLMVGVLKRLLSIAVPMIETDDELGLEILYHSLNGDVRFFRDYGHDWREKRGEVLTKEEMDTEEWKEWFAAGQPEDSWVDYYHSNRWKSGVIKAKVRGTLRSGDEVSVLRIEPKGTPYTVSRDAPYDEIPFDEGWYQYAAPGGYKYASRKAWPHMSQWRRELVEKSVCDGLDSVRKWYTVNVVNVCDEMNQVRVNFDGWSERYNDWFDRDNPKLQAHKRFAKGGRTEGGVVAGKNDTDIELDDQDDPDDPAVFAVDRGMIGGTSYHTVTLVNEFGRLGGFEALTKRLKQREPNMPVKNLRYLIGAISKCVKCLTRATYTKYILPMQELVMDTLKNLSDVELRDLKKEWLTKIVGCVEAMLRRSMDDDNIAKVVETFQLEMALRRIKSASIERRLNGVQYIGTICSATRAHAYRQIQVSYLTPALLNDWIKSHNLIEYLFSAKSHPQIMKNSTDILRFLCAENFLTREYLTCVWNAITRAAAKEDDVDGELKTLTKIIDDLSLYLKPSHFDFLFQQFEAIELGLLTSEHLKLMKELAKHNSRGEIDDDILGLDDQPEGDSAVGQPGELADGDADAGADGADKSAEDSAAADGGEQKTEESTAAEDPAVSTAKTLSRMPPAQRALKILWRLIQEDSGASLSIVNEAKTMIRDTLNLYYTRELRMPVLKDCVSNLEKSKSVVVSLQLMQLILLLYPLVASTLADEGDRWTIIVHLVQDLKMVEFLFADITRFKERAEARAKEVLAKKSGLCQSDQYTLVDNMCLDGPSSYSAEIDARFKFLDFILEQSKNQIKLNKDQMRVIWQFMVVKNLTQSEKDRAMSWIAKVAVASPPLIEDDVAQYIFEEEILKDFQPQHLTLAGFECFFAFFVSVNKTAGNIEVPSGTSYFVEKYDDLIGVDSIWAMVLHSRNDEVNQKAIDLLNQLCTRLTPDKRDMLATIRGAMLKRTMDELQAAMKRVSEATTDEEKSLANHHVMRVIRLIHHFLNATESRGVGGLKAHNALSRGKTWVINVIDKVNYNGYGRPPHIRVTVRENDSMWDLRTAIGNKLKTYPELLILGNPPSRPTIGEELNSQTVSSLGIRDGQTIHAEKIDQTPLRVPLVSGKPPQLVEACKNALKGIFRMFAKNEDGTMSAADMREYIIACGAGEHSATPTRIQNIFRTFGDFVDRLDGEGFCKFYKQACIDRPHHVWNDLTVYGYRYDLRRHEDARKEEEELLRSKPESLPRYILSSDAGYFDLINECLTLDLKDAELVEQSWKLLLRLPTNPALRARLLQLEDVGCADDWKKLLPSDNIFRLTYSLIICESLTIEPEKSESAESMKERAQWRSTFLAKGGFDYLVQLMKDIKLGESSSEDDSTDIASQTQQLAVASILKVVNSFFVGAIACLPSMEDMVAQIQSLTLEVQDEPVASEDSSSTEEKKESKDSSSSGKAPMAPGSKQVNFDSFDDDWSADYGGYSNMQEDEEDDLAVPGEVEESMASLLEKLYEEQIDKASGIPEEVLAEMKAAGANRKKKGKGGSGAPAYGPVMEGESGEEKVEKEEKVESDSKAAPPVSAPPPTLPRASSIQKFNELVIATTREYSQRLLDGINYNDLLVHLLSILKFASSSKQVTQERDLVVRYAVRMWVSLLLYRPELLPDLFDTLKADPSFILTALQSTDKEIGTEFAKSIRKLCQNVSSSPNYTDELSAKLPRIDIVNFFLRELLLKHLPKGASDEIDPEQHFNLLIALLTTYSEYGGNVKDFGELFEFLVDQLIGYRSKEIFGEVTYDKVLSGLMTLLCVLIANEKSFRIKAAEKGLLLEVFDNFLFASGKTVEDKASNLPKCKVFSSRRLAFRLLVLLCVGVPENFAIIRPKIEAIQESVTPPSMTTFEYSPDRDTRSPAGFVGLRNMGSTCYMNSLMQQFYMIPHFRHCVMDAGKLLEETLSVEEKKESLLYQAMKTFAFLTLSEKQAFDTQHFCYSYKDEFGNPIDTRIQQDAQEFFNILTDRIEYQLKDTQFKYLMQDSFGGKVVNQMICQGGCGTIREREQQFLMVSLPIKSRTTMIESLDAYVMAEMLEGVSCDTCGKKCDTKKREVLADLPNTIFFQLKRFELNFETFRQEKINQRLEFPTEIDLEPFTKEGLARVEKEKQAAKDANVEVPEKYSEHPEEYYQYELVGIVIHSGSADAGHYYSYIRDRKSGVWNEFNDSIVKPWNIETNLERDCFGGARKEKSYYGWSSGWDSHEKINNGYILVYDRKKFITPLHPLPEKKDDSSAAADGGAASAAAGASAGDATEEKGAGAVDESKAADDSTSDLNSKADASVMSLDSSVDAAAVASPKLGTDEEVSGLDDELAADAAKGSTAGGTATADGESKDEEPEDPFVNVLNFFDVEPRDVITKPIYDSILNDNIQFARQRQVFNQTYFKFVFDALRVVQPVSCEEYYKPALDGEGGESTEGEDETIGGSPGATDGTPKTMPMDDILRSNPSFANIQMATHVCFRYLAKISDKGALFEKFATYLRWLYSTNVPACVWFLDYLTTGDRAYTMLPDYLLKTRELVVQKEFAKLIAHSIKILAPFEQDRLTQFTLKRMTYKTQAGVEQELEYQWGVTFSARMIDVLSQMMETAAKYWYRFHNYFELFVDLTQMGGRFREYMVNKRFIMKLGDFYMGKQGPYAAFQPHKTYTPMGTRAFPAKFDSVIVTIAELMCSCHSPSTRNHLKKLAETDPAELTDEDKTILTTLPPTSRLVLMRNEDGSISTEEGLLPLGEMDEKLPHNRNFYTLLIRDAEKSKAALNALNDIVCHWAFADRNYSEEVAKIIHNGIDKAGADNVSVYLKIMERFVSIDDSLKPNRLARLHSRDFGVLYLIGVYKTQHQPFCYATIQGVIEIMQSSTEYRSYMIERRAAWKWWDAWLDTYCHKKSYYHGYAQTELDQIKLIFWDEYCKFIPSLGLDLQRAASSAMSGAGSGLGRGGAGRAYDESAEEMDDSGDPEPDLELGEAGGESGDDDSGAAVAGDDDDEAGVAAAGVPPAQGGPNAPGQQGPAHPPGHHPPGHHPPGHHAPVDPAVAAAEAGHPPGHHPPGAHPPGHHAPGHPPAGPHPPAH